MKTLATCVARGGVRSIVITIGIVAIGASVTRAQDYFVDQRNDGFTPGTYYSIPLNEPIGQEFTPSLDHVDVVDLYISAQVQTLIQLLIHEGTIHGDVIGGATTDVVWPTAPPARFEFASSVELVPGELYVIEVQADSQCFLGVAPAQTDPYSGGDLIIVGHVYNGFDAWFREGVWDVSSAQMSTWGAIKALYER